MVTSLLGGSIAEIIGEAVVVTVGDQVGAGSDEGGEQHRVEQAAGMVDDLIG